MKFENHYTCKTEWSQNDECFIAKVIEFPSLSAFGDTREEAQKELDNVIEFSINWMEEEGGKIPQPISEKEFKGNIVLRIPPQTHKNIVELAMENGVFLNQFITSIIEKKMYNDLIFELINKIERKIMPQFEYINHLTFQNQKIAQASFVALENQQNMNNDYTVDNFEISDNPESIFHATLPSINYAQNKSQDLINI